MRDLHCSCWLLTTKKLQKESKFRRGKSLTPLENQRAKYSVKKKLEGGYKISCNRFIIVIEMSGKSERQESNY